MAQGSHITMIAVLLLAVLSMCEGQRRPPNYSLEAMPETSFDCRDKSIGGYYADPEADCQMFHVCVKMSENDIQDFRFLCPNDTMFDQENQICANWFDIDCEANSLYYSKGFDLLRLGKGVANEDLLQKSPVPERRLPTVVVPRPEFPRNLQRDEQDLFRGSSSSDIHRGRDEEDEEFERQNKKKTKVVARRKQQQNRGRRPVITTTFRPDEITTITPEEFRTEQQASTPEYTNINRNRNTEQSRGTPAPLTPTFNDQPKSTFQSTNFPQATSPQPSQQRNFQINVPNKPENFQRNPQRNNFQNNDFQRTQPRNNFQQPQQGPPAPFNGESQRSQPRNFQTAPTRQNDLSRGSQRFNGNGQQQNQQPQGDVNRIPSRNQNNFQNAPNQQNFQNQSPRNQQRNQVPSSFVTPPPAPQVSASTFQASTAAPIVRTTFNGFPSSTFAPIPSKESSRSAFVSSTIAPTTFHRNLVEDDHPNPSTISPTTYNNFQQRKNLHRNRFPTTPAPDTTFSSKNNNNNNQQRQFASSPAPTFQQAVSSIAPTQQTTPRPQQFIPTTYRPRQPQNNVPQPFQQRRVPRPRDDFINNEHPDEILNTAHSSSFRASDLNAIQKSKSTFAPTTSAPFPAPSSPRSFTPPRQNNQNRQPTPAPQNFDRSTQQDNRRPSPQNQPTQFVNSPSTAQFVNPSTLKPTFIGTHHFNPSSPEPFHQPAQQNFFNPSTAKPQQFNPSSVQPAQFNPSSPQPPQQRFNNPSTPQPPQQRFNNPSTPQQRFNNPSTPQPPQQRFNNPSSPQPPQQRFNNPSSPQTSQQRFSASSPQPFSSQPQQNFFNPSTSKSSSPADNVFFTTPSPRPSSTFFNPSSPQPNSPTFFNSPSNPAVASSTPQPFVQRASSPRGFSSPNTPQPFQQSRVSSPVASDVPEKSTTRKPHKKANKDYDYAYYDDTPFDEYDGIEHISEFTKTHKG